MAASNPVTPDTQVTFKINFEGSNRKFKLPLRDLGATTLPDKLRTLLSISPSDEAVFERYSDSAAAFIVLDPNNAAVYKQLHRAAKAKLKLRVRATVKPKAPVVPKPASVEDETETAVTVASATASTTAPTPAPTTVNANAQTYALIMAERLKRVKESLPEAELSTENAAKLEKYRLKFERLSLKPTVLLANPSSPDVKQTIIDNVTKNLQTGLPSAESMVDKLLSPASEDELTNTVTVTRGPAACNKWFADRAPMTCPYSGSLAVPSQTNVNTFSVYCNRCNAAIPDAHYHCSTCDDGDFDLCQACIDKGVVCDGSNHWMIKRFVKNGKVINSTTETLAPKIPSSDSKTTLVAVEEPAKEAAKEDKVEKEEILASAWDNEVETRTCNSCVQEYRDEDFVTCTVCDDFDLCISCLVENQHGHHPKHAFKRAQEDMKLDKVAKKLLAPGRNAGHHAICDGCDKYIYGVRHKCLDCPDWDYCDGCIVNADFIHPRHRFVPIYEPIADIAASSRAFSEQPRHHSICCDGPLCNMNGRNSTYIVGDRYKCAVCHDTDFCASCEASPANHHNKTHPLIKFRTPVRNVSVTTVGEHGNGQRMPVLGDRRPIRTSSKATETTPVVSSSAATQVQTVADLKPTEVAKTEKPAEVKPIRMVAKPAFAPYTPPKLDAELDAHFVRDSIADGTTMPPSSVFEQTWTLKNAGTTSWPAGCSVKFVGGDNMLAVDSAHPASVHELVSASESTVCYSPVSPNQEFSFTVLMRSPSRPGKAISYWRLTGPSGIKFGHRLWCDITVKAPESNPVEEAKTRAELRQSLIAEMKTGQQALIDQMRKVVDKFDSAGNRSSKEVVTSGNVIKDVIASIGGEPAEPTEAEQAKSEPEAESVKSEEHSQMIFPKLEKESPASSIHHDAPVVADSSAASEDLDEEDFVEPEIDDLEEDEETEGFFTDDEYDILDASDEEYLAEHASASRK